MMHMNQTGAMQHIVHTSYCLMHYIHHISYSCTHQIGLSAKRSPHIMYASYFQCIIFRNMMCGQYHMWVIQCMGNMMCGEIWCMPAPCGLLEMCGTIMMHWAYDAGVIWHVDNMMHREYDAGVMWCVGEYDACQPYDLFEMVGPLWCMPNMMCGDLFVFKPIWFMDQGSKVTPGNTANT